MKVEKKKWQMKQTNVNKMVNENNALINLTETKPSNQGKPKAKNKKNLQKRQKQHEEKEFLSLQTLYRWKGNLTGFILNN